MQAVRRGNESVVKLTIKGLLCYHIQVYTITEQPVSSLMNYVPFFRRMLQVTDCRMSSTFLGQFGSVSCKPIKLFHNTGWVGKLRRPRPKGMLRLYKKGPGKKSKKQPAPTLSIGRNDANGDDSQPHLLPLARSSLDYRLCHLTW